MEKKQISKLLEALLNAEGVKGKKLLERVLWLNTTKAKYNVGDVVIFSSPGSYIYGVPVRSFYGVITKINYFSDCHIISYSIDCPYTTKDGRSGITYQATKEGNIERKTTKKTYQNLITCKDKYECSMDI